MGGGRDYRCDLLRNIHEGLGLPEGVMESAFVAGDYLFYHYGCDGFDDRGWGCGYRTLMSLCSWLRGQISNAKPNAGSIAPVPSNHRVQEILVEISDKEKNFLGSKQWIGSVEVCLVIDTLYDVRCQIIHVKSGEELSEHINTLMAHFKTKGSPIMMGGDTDVSSKGIVGVCKNATDTYLLVVDPHYWGEARDVASLQASGWAKWQSISDFQASSFYNLCLPQFTAKSLENSA
ncbi:ufm1-specific protease 1-like [Penaeus japonicus]|uniref:ufm1-specific protease 1-like n=1 Tax=Penaeus japonicus TaxID=27405 RepID=UPI001C70B071|nr:ufm1-specific protease 1-like [Penaeus japonicus]XP_042885072.1 ufm1-specific protease 1-like [Penaeus japonicus]XP_042885073.1 ufm1-specific protease 1-like [Penaeus japonicus]XP_042885074.1 ufm1-specific protease 1-like [Penaeus japonicus]